MASLIVSSKCVEIQSNNYGILAIKNVKTNANAENFPILFKIKTNLKELVDVRPSFGVIQGQSQKSTVALNVKYSGTQQHIDKAKLMINWFSTEDKKQFENRKFNHEQFNAYFNSAKKISEGSLLLPIVFKENAQKQRNELNKSQQAPSRQSEEPTIVNVEGKTGKFSQQREIESTKQHESKLQSVSSELSSKSPKLSEKAVKSGYSLKIMGLVIIIAFIFGVSVGIKVERYVQPYINQLSSKINEYIQNFSLNQNEQITQTPKQASQPQYKSQKTEQPVAKAENQQAQSSITNPDPSQHSSEQI